MNKENEFRYEIKKWIADELKYVAYTEEGYLVLLYLIDKIDELEKDLDLV